MFEVGKLVVVTAYDGQNPHLIGKVGRVRGHNCGMPVVDFPGQRVDVVIAPQYLEPVDAQVLMIIEGTDVSMLDANTGEVLAQGLTAVNIFLTVNSNLKYEIQIV